MRTVSPLMMVAFGLALIPASMIDSGGGPCRSPYQPAPGAKARRERRKAARRQRKQSRR